MKVEKQLKKFEVTVREIVISTVKLEAEDAESAELLAIEMQIEGDPEVEFYFVEDRSAEAVEIK